MCYRRPDKESRGRSKGHDKGSHGHWDENCENEGRKFSWLIGLMGLPL